MDKDLGGGEILSLLQRYTLHSKGPKDRLCRHTEPASSQPLSCCGTQHSEWVSNLSHSYHRLG